MTIRVSVITVSDTASVDAAADKSGPAIKEILNQRDAFSVDESKCLIIADDKESIRRVVEEVCTSGDVDWLISTGGTGFGVRDVTPEAITPLIERHAPGLVHLMLSSSLKKTPFAALSRPVAGTISSTMVTTLPGSVKAVKENLEALLDGGVINHAIDLIRGGTGKRVHSQLASGTDQKPLTLEHTHTHDHHHHHHHHHGHNAPVPRSTQALSNDPNAPVTTRYRKSPFPLVSFEDALKVIRENIQPLNAQKSQVTPELGGCVLAEDVNASVDVPLTPTTSVDGYAMRSSDPPGVYKVLTSQTHKISTTLPEGYIYRINTGGPLPVGADTVIMVEDTELVSTVKDENTDVLEESEVKTLVQVPPNDNVRAAGSDVRKGDLVLRAGDRLTRGGGEVGTLTFVGRREVSVIKKPSIALLSTGNELVDLHQDPHSTSGEEWGGIFDTNRPSLQSVLQSLGYEVFDLGIAPDTVDAHTETLKMALQKADLVLTTGGTSMGPTDLLKPVIERQLNGTIHFGRVSIKPGKPTTFATVPVGDRRKPVFALPGNPASALVTFYIFVLPALRMLGGWPEKMCNLPRVIVQVQNRMPLDPRVEFHRVVIRSSTKAAVETDATGTMGNATMVLKAYSTGGQRSSRVASLAEANGLVVLPMLGHGVQGTKKTALEPGDFAEAVLLGEIEMD